MLCVRIPQLFDYGYFFFIHSSVDGHLGWFLTSAIRNCAAVNMAMRLPHRTLTGDGMLGLR